MENNEALNNAYMRGLPEEPTSGNSQTDSNPVERKLAEDSAGLGSIAAVNSWRIGHVGEVNGSGAEELPDFVPTRHELLVLAQYWLKELLQVRFDWFLYAETGSRAIRIEPFAQRRLDRIKSLVGAEAIDGVSAKVDSDFAAKIDLRAWNMFLSGKEPERDDRGIPVLPNE